MRRQNEVKKEKRGTEGRAAAEVNEANEENEERENLEEVLSPLVVRLLEVMWQAAVAEVKVEVEVYSLTLLLDQCWHILLPVRVLSVVLTPTVT